MMGCSWRSVGTQQHAVRVRNMSWICCEDELQGSRWGVNVKLALATEVANLQQVDSGAVVLRRGAGHQGSPAPRRHGRGIMTFLARRSIRPSSPVAPSKTGRSRHRSDSLILLLAHPRLLATFLDGMSTR